MINSDKNLLKRYAAAFVLSAVFVVSMWGCAQEKPDPNEIRASGVIETTEVLVQSKAKGEVLRLFVREGDEVRKGGMIAQIDTADYILELNFAEAGLSSAMAQLALIQAGARTEDIAAAQEQVNQAESNLSNAAADFDRFKALFEERSVTQKQLEDSETRYNVAEALYRQNVQRLSKLENGPIREEIKVAEAQVNLAQASIELSRKRISDCSIAAPISGTVVEQLIEEGELASAGRALLTLADLSRVTLTIYVKETDLGKVRFGQNAEVFIDSYPDRTFSGAVSYISGKAEFTPKNIQTKEERVKLVYRIEISLSNPEGIFKAGMPADAVLR